MASSTMYITIPKERAARILTDTHSTYTVTDDSSDEIVVKKESLGYQHRATLTDYELPQARLESGDASVEAGTVGTKVTYSHSTVYDDLKEYEV